MQTTIINYAQVEAMQLMAIKVHIVTWRPHSSKEICQGSFLVNDNLLEDLENMYML